MTPTRRAATQARVKHLLLLALIGASAFAQEVEDVVDAGVDVVPPQLIQPSPAAYPEDAGIGGDVELLLTIDTRGFVTDITVQSSVGEPFTEAALLAAKGLLFEPATQKGAPVSVLLAFRYRFEQAVSIAFDAGAISPFGTLNGKVLTRGTRESIPLAQVGLEDGGVTNVETDAEGRFTLQLPPG